MRPTVRIVAAFALVLALVITAPGGPEIQGQRATPVPAATGYPAYLQVGTCDQPGAPIAALAMTAIGVQGGGADGTIVTPSTTALPAAVSVTEVDRPLADLLREGLIVRVAESEARPQVDIACGPIDGRPDADGNLYLTVSERNDSGVTGVVWFQGEGAVTTVTLFLIPAIGASDATPVP